MKYGYVHHKEGKYALHIPRAEEYLSSPAVSEADHRRMKEKLCIDEIRARVSSVPLHLTLG
jgi:hypothetical protein